MLGRMILEDYSAGAVLERLLRYERRIEGSLLRNVNELRRVNDQRRKADGEAASTLARWREEDDQAWKAQAFAPWRPGDSPSRPDGPTTNTPRFETPDESDVPSCLDSPGAANAAVGHEMCETNPIGPEPNTSQVLGCTAVMSASAPEGLWETNPIWSAPRGTDIPRVSPNHGRDAHATEIMDPRGTEAAVGQEMCETNPIGPEPKASQVPHGTEVMSASASAGLRKTNPIWRAPCGTGIPPVSPDHGRTCPERSRRDAHATCGRDAHGTALTDPGVASAEPGGRDTPRGQSCEPNPIPESLKFAVSSVKCTNRPNSGCRADQEIGVPGANGAKQSQLREQADAVDLASAALGRPRP